MLSDLKITLLEATVSEFQEIKISLSNIGTDATSQKPTATVSLRFENSKKDKDYIVSVGDKLKIAKTTFQISSIDSQSHRASVILQALQNQTKNTTLEVLLLLLFLSFPYLVKLADLRFGIALISLLFWVVVLQPSWRGLTGFYGTSLLFLHVVVLGIIWV